MLPTQIQVADEREGQKLVPKLLQKPQHRPALPVSLACRWKAAALGAQTASPFSLRELQAYNLRQRLGQRPTYHDGLPAHNPVQDHRDSG